MCGSFPPSSNIFPMDAYFRAAFLSLVFLAVIPSGACHSEEPTSPSGVPIGVWKTFDDKTGNARAIVRIYEQEGKLFGRIEQSFTPGAEHRVCAECTDERKNQAIVGLIIIRNMKRDGNEYNGGDILDPESGSVYRCKMHLEQDGTRLILRGYIGFSLLGRTQTWQRQS
jgi:uncharacterized protein (DUF2147 family)